MRYVPILAVLLSLAGIAPVDLQAAELRIGTFNVDATPPLGSPVAYAAARKIEDPLSARGIVLLSNEKPVVLCALDWIGISNEGHEVFREKLARAAGTTADRVAVHALHQHDGPRCDFSAEAILEDAQLGGSRFDNAFARSVIEKVAKAVAEAVTEAQPVTHLGVGRAKVEKVASNRRLLGPDGKVKIMRFSASRNPEAIAAPEGVIDPELKLISFWNGETPVASLTYYATHPQSYYGKGDVTSEFVGLARAAREKALPQVAHIHFNGASGNVAAGKYNNGSPEVRPILAQRMEAGMKAAWESTRRQPISADDLKWNVEPVQVPVGRHVVAEELKKSLHDEKVSSLMRVNAAVKLAFLQRREAGIPIELTCLHLGDVAILHMPGELFVEYQLAAQRMAPEKTVCMAAYGEYGTGYIGTQVAYGQGGYETSNRASNVAPEVEPVLMDGMRKLLGSPRRKVAGVTTNFRKFSHADVLIGRTLKGYHMDRRGGDDLPSVKVTGLYVDQRTDTGLAAPLAKEFDVLLVDSVAEALKQGTNDLAVDGVLLVAEHGDYPLSETGQKLYPKRRLFTEIVQVFEQTGKIVPVFSDKHLSDNWTDAKWIYDTAKEKGIPLMAGSSLPSYRREPAADVAAGTKLEEIVSIGYGGVESYGFHALEMLQCLAEKRAGGETGVRSVTTLSGDAVWAAAGKLYDRKLVDAALEKGPHKRRTDKPLEEVVKKPVLFSIEYNDGLRASMIMLQGMARDFSVAWREDGKTDITATCFALQNDAPYIHFQYLLQGFERMLDTGEPAWPVERTLLTTGILHAAMKSLSKEGETIKTPHLDIQYRSDWKWQQPPEFERPAETPKTSAIPAPRGITSPALQTAS